MATEGETRKRKRRGGKGNKNKNKAKNQNQNKIINSDNNDSNKKIKTNQQEPFSNSNSNSNAKSSSSKPKPPTSSPSFLDKMKARLTGGHFRMLNEKLYTCTGSEALEYFKENPSLFNLYHTGYQEQMSHWPELPVNVIVNWLKDRNSSLVVADFGCGDARLEKNVKNKVFSLDLVSSGPSVIACDMSNTPLDSSSVDVAVFCLSLMGTDFPSYLQEAHRVLKPSGWLLIAEVKSRFDPNTGGADPNKFVKAICRLGFSTISKDFSNKMFIMLYFKKKDNQHTDPKNIEWPQLKPCLYKRR